MYLIVSEFVAGRDGGDENLAGFESDFGVLRLVESREIRENSTELVGQLGLLVANLFDQRDHLPPKLRMTFRVRTEAEEEEKEDEAKKAEDAEEGGGVTEQLAKEEEKI